MDEEQFVVCQACGARIKATRPWCLRCFEPLQVDESALPFWRTLKISDRTGIAFVALGLVALVALAWVLWSTRQPTFNDLLTSTPQRVAPTAPAVPMTRAADSAPVDGPTRETFEEALRANPDNAAALNGLGLLLERSKDLTAAEAKFVRAIEVSADVWTYHFNLAHVEAQLGRTEKAIAHYREALKRSPYEYAIHYNLGLALQKKGDEAGAIAEYGAAIQLEPREASPYLALAEILEGAGRTADAVSAYRHYLSLSPSDAEARKVKEHLELLTSAAARGTAEP